jgi:hypothetical protein
MIEEASTVQHPGHPIPNEVAEGLQRFNEQELSAAAHQFEFAKLARPTDEERQLTRGLYETIGTSLGVDIEEYRAQSSALQKRQFKRIQSQDRPALQTYGDLVPMDFEPPAPERSDPSFWWAHWHGFVTAPFTGEAQADGTHLRGKKTSDSGSLQRLTYGVVSRYELQADRIPQSSTGRWSSAPGAELFGDLLAWTGEGDIFAGDCWSKCWMVRRQTLFQWIFGPPGSGPKRIGEAVEVQNIFFEENRNRAQSHRLPGFQAMPVVVLPNIFSGASIWADLEVRFDIQLEGNALHWIDPFDLLVRLPQWPLLPNA